MSSRILVGSETNWRFARRRHNWPGLVISAFQSFQITPRARTGEAAFDLGSTAKETRLWSPFAPRLSAMTVFDMAIVSVFCCEFSQSAKSKAGLRMRTHLGYGVYGKGGNSDRNRLLSLAVFDLPSLTKIVVAFGAESRTSCQVDWEISLDNSRGLSPACPSELVSGVMGENVGLCVNE